MSYPTLAAAAIVFLAFLAHATVGRREALSTRPPRADSPNYSAGVERNWVQSMCAFQMVTIDLLVLALLLTVLGTTDWIPAKRQVKLVASGFFALWGVAWLLQLVVLRRGRNDYLLLGQWSIWLVCSGLLYWGARVDHG